MTIEEWRNKIDAIDSEILRLLNQRAECTSEIGLIKCQENLPVYAPEREAAILQRLAEENKGPMTQDGVRRVFERIIDESRKLEKERILKTTKKE